MWPRIKVLLPHYKSMHTAAVMFSRCNHLWRCRTMENVFNLNQVSSGTDNLNREVLLIRTFSSDSWTDRLQLNQVFGSWWVLWKTYPICAGQGLTIDTQGAERGVCGQTLVPLAGPGLWDGFHEVLLQLTDAGVMPEQVLLRLFELLQRGEGGGRGGGV